MSDDLFAQFDMTRADPAKTYLAGHGYTECWIGSRWDVARDKYGFHVYRKGAWAWMARTAETAAAVIAEDLGLPTPLARLREGIEAIAANVEYHASWCQRAKTYWLNNAGGWGDTAECTCPLAALLAAGEETTDG